MITRRRLVQQSVATVAGLALGRIDGLLDAGRASDVRVSNDRFASHAEAYVAADPHDPKRLLGVCIVGARDGATSLATYASFDGGASWNSNGALRDSAGGRDPTVAFNAAGEAVVCGNTGAVSIWRSDDLASFDHPLHVSREKADHPWLAADPAGREVYAVWSTAGNMGLAFVRSANGGRTFGKPRTIARAGGRVIASPSLAAGRNGVVCAAFGVWPPLASGGKASSKDIQAKRRPEIIAPISVVCSRDGGHTFGKPVELGVGGMEIWLPGGASGLGLPAVAADTRRDALYVGFVSRAPGADHSEIVVSVSRDRGATWSTPVHVTRPQRGVFYFQPQVAVDEAGRLGVSAFAFERSRVSVELAISTGRSLRFDVVRRVSATAFDPARGGLPGGAKHGAWWLGDYQGLAVTPGRFHPFWSDTRTGRLELFAARVRSR